MARVDRLSDDLKQVLQVAAVLGREFSGRLLDSLCGKSTSLRSIVSELERLDLIHQRGADEESVYAFKHALTQETVYGSLLTTRRQALHDAAGLALESLWTGRLENYYEVLAHHFLKSANITKALDYLELANQKAARASAMMEAKAYFVDALHLLEQLPDSATKRRRLANLILNQVYVFFLPFQLEEYYELLTKYESVVSEAGDAALLGRLLGCRGHCLWFFGRLDEAIAVESEAVKLCEVAGSFDGTAYAYANMAWCYYFKGKYETVAKCVEAALAASGRSFNLRFHVNALAAGSIAYSLRGLWEHAIREAREALEISQRYQDDSLISMAAWILAVAHVFRGDVREGLAQAQFAVDRAPTLADRLWAEGILGWGHCRAGELDVGLNLLESLLPVARMAGATGQWYIQSLGEAYIMAHRLDEAEELLENLLATAEPADWGLTIGPSHRLLAEVALGRDTDGTLETARFHVERAISILSEQHAAHELACAYVSYGRVERRLGRVREARDHFGRSLEIFERLGTLIEPDRVREALAELAAT